MSVNLFFTLQSLPGANGLNVSQGALSPSGQGALQGISPGMSFVDFILARLSENPEETSNQKQPEPLEPLASKNPALDKNPKPDIVEILAASSDITEVVEPERGGEAFSPDLMTQITDTLHLNQKALDEALSIENLASVKVTRENLPQVRTILESLLIGGEVEKGTPEKTALENIIRVMERLVENDSPAAIVVNLTPEQVFQIKERIFSLGSDVGYADKDIPSENDHQSPEFFIALVNITPPHDVAEQITAQSKGSRTPANDLAARLNALLVGEKENGGPLPFNAMPDETTEDFKNLIQQYTGNKAKAADQAADMPAAQNKTAVSGAQTAVLQNWQFDSYGTLIVPATFSENYFEGASAAPLSSPSSAVNPVTQIQGAGHAHPATQIIAASLQRNAAGGENRHFTLQLDPPELGRIEVRMDFGKDKVLKTHMVIEKPETFFMLQRDGHALERALQDLGLDGESSLSFELASEGYEFSQNGSHDGRSGQSGGSSENSEMEIIEAAMDWYIDPESGLMRYDFTV